MTTIARYILDERLNEVKSLMEGPVLDIGGERGYSIGRFRPPDNIKWFYVNLEKRYMPDVLGNCYSLPFLDNSFNTVVMCELLEHLKKPEKALDEAYRVLRRNGRLVLSMPFLYRHHRNPHDYQRWTHEKIYDELQSRGFEVEVFLPRGAWLVTTLDIFTQGMNSFVPGSFFGSRALSLIGRFLTWSVKKTYSVWSRFDRYLSREDVTKSTFHRFTTGYVVVAKKVEVRKEKTLTESSYDALRFPKI